MAGFFDWLANAVGSVVRDARQRVVERGWFGEVVTPRGQNITFDMVGKQSPGEDRGWFDRFFDKEARGAERGQEYREPSREQSPDRDR